MALMPKRMKYRKEQRGKIRGVAQRGNTVEFGEYGLQAIEGGRLTGRQIEAGRVAMAHFLGGEGKVWIRMFPHKPYTATPAETRMGKGKGEPEYYAAIVRPGNVIFEIGGISELTAKQAFNRTAHKMPIATRFVKRRHKL